MENFTIKKDISVLYVQAVSFPMGVGGAFVKLHALLPDGSSRQLYGISNPDASYQIIYRAAAEAAYPGESEELGCETFIIKKGIYTSIYLPHWKQDETSVGRAFQELLKHPDIHPQGYCLEIYVGENDVRCLVPLK